MTELETAHKRIADLEGRVQELGQMARDVNSRRVAELEAQLASIGAGGVGSLMGHHFEGLLGMVGRWYMVNECGMATLCADKADAELAAAEAQAAWPRMGPHRAVQLVEAAPLLRAANAGSEPVAWPKNAAEVREFIGGNYEAMEFGNADQSPSEDDRYKLTAHDFLSSVIWWADFPHQPSPPEGMAGWRDIATAPKDKTNVLLLLQPCGSVANGFWLAEAYAGNGAWIWPYVHKNPTHWMPAPPLASEAKGAT